MHKFPKKFGRRKSTANALENPEPPVESSFKVFERPQPGAHKSGPSFDGGVKFARAIGTPDSHKEDNLFEGMKVNTVNRLVLKIHRTFRGTTTRVYPWHKLMKFKWQWSIQYEHRIDYRQFFALECSIDGPFFDGNTWSRRLETPS